MGVPKFYRWISERYPCLSQVIKDYQIPEFDNFYLDMNGIIHVCAHPNDDDPTFRISDDKIFTDIFNYIEALFRIIKPQKVMFLAVDGVAPRAKMNQQRGRRFRSAREAQDLIRKAVQKGTVLPTAPRFDSNCITPGTEFMARLHTHLKYFVHKKLSTDPSWQGVEVILSGHDVPGEGEHKIMDYIRFKKAQPDYDSNTRHCLYGLDADLIMLGLLSHEPHFSLLREEVRFGRKNQKRSTSPNAVTFHLLHLSIMRECLDYEFSELKDKIPFKFDLEKIIDDWILMGFLVGNDFLPHIPNMHIRQDALPYLYQKYKEVLPTLGGYINNGGNLNMERFELYLKAIAQFDYDHYDELSAGMRWFESKKQHSREKKKAKKPNGKKTVEPVPVDEVDFMFPAAFGEDKEEDEAVAKLQRDLGIRDLETYFQEEDQERNDTFESEFAEFKATYYKEKLGFVHVDQSVLAEQAKCYVVGIQWVLNYYYSGVPSWSWFYPYHYAPFVSDVRGFSDLQIEFELGNPFVPFEQLLAVLPPASKALLPSAYQGLMVNEDSPIKMFYPVEFETDLNGKQQEWEAVVLIPFIDERQLVTAMEPCTARLLPEEASRNRTGHCMVCSHDPTAPSMLYLSPWPELFPDIHKCQVSVLQLPFNPYPVLKEQLVQGLCEGVKLDVYFPGFPTLKHVTHTSHFEKRGVRVFQSASRDENLILTITRSDSPQDLMKLAKKLVGKTCFVGWPYMVEAKVHSIAHKDKLYYLDKASAAKPRVLVTELGNGEMKKLSEEKMIASRSYIERKGVEVGDIEVMVYAQVLQGKRYMVDKKKEEGVVYLHKEWAVYPEPYPLQTVVLDITSYAPEYREQVQTLTDLFPVDSRCFLLSSAHYGQQADVLSVEVKQFRVRVLVESRTDIDLTRISHNRHLSVRYLPSYMVGDRLGLPPLLLSRITGTIQVERGTPDNVKDKEKLNVGFCWKFARKNLEIPGYARKLDNGGWSYSTDAVEQLERFMQRFPVMFQFLALNPSNDKYYESDLFPDPEGSESLSAVREWIKQLPSQGVEAVDCGTELLDSPQIAAIEKTVAQAKQQYQQKEKKFVKLRVKPSALFKPTYQQGNLIPDPAADYELYDRVVNVSISNAVPFGLRGTIIGILGEDNHSVYEILFDEEFLGGLTLRCSPNRAYRLPASCLLNLSYGKRSQEDRGSQQPNASQSHLKSGTSYASAALSSRGNEGSLYQYDYTGEGYNYQRSSRRSFDTPDGASPRTFSGPGGRGHSPGGRGYSPNNGRGRQGAGRGNGQRGGGNRGGSPQKDSPLAKSGSVPTLMTRGPAAGERKGSEFSALLQEMTASHPSTAFKQPETTKQSKQASSKAKKSQKSGTKKKSIEAEKDPLNFSAAISALENLDISTPAEQASPAQSAESSTSQAQSEAVVSQNVGGKGVAETKSEKRSRDLSPSVAAMFEAVERETSEIAAGKETVPKPHPKTVVTESQATSKESESSTALKNLLNIGSPPSTTSAPAPSAQTTPRPPPPRPSYPAFPGAYSYPNIPQSASPGMPEALLKYMRPPMAPSTNHASSRPGLLPSPYPRAQLPPTGGGMALPGFPGSARPYIPRAAPSSHMPMPYGPPQYDPIQQLMLTAHSLGFPPPKVTAKAVPNGYLGLAEVGHSKYKGSVCPTPDEARFSAANVANINIKPQAGPQHPLLQFPSLYSVQPGPYHYHPGAPPPPQLPLQYPPQGPGVPRGVGRNPFVPLQAQRKQAHKPAESAQIDPLPIHSTGTGGLPQDSSKQQELGKQTVTTAQGSRGDDTVPVPTTGGGTELEVPKIDAAKPDLIAEASARMNKVERGDPTASRVQVGDVVPETGEGRTVVSNSPEDSEREEKHLQPAGGAVEDSRAPEPAQKSDDPEMALLQRMEVTVDTSIAAQKQLQKLTQLMSVLEKAPKEIAPDVSVMEPVNEGTQVSSELVGDPIAHAALIGGMLEDRKEEEDEEVYLESTQPSNSAQVDDSVVVIAGEIVSADSIGLGRGTGSSGDSRSAIEYENVAPGQEAGEEQPMETPAQDSASVSNSAGKVTSNQEASSPAPPRSSKTASKRPKFQLAASFSK